MPVLTATLSKDRHRVVLVKQMWRLDCPIADLPRWITLYRDLHDRQDGRFARFYAADLLVLERLQKDLHHEL